MKNQKEVWKDVKNYEGIYEISNFGRVKSLERIDAAGKRRKEKYLKVYKNIDGYCVVGLSLDGRLKIVKVHRLVAFAFLKKSSKNIVNHKDSNRSNNNSTNLEWCTVKENVNHSFEFGKRVGLSGENHNLCKLNKSNVLSIRKSRLSAIELSEKYNVSLSNIYLVLRFKTWKNV